MKLFIIFNWIIYRKYEYEYSLKQSIVNSFNKSPKISIFLPIFNQEKFIKAAIRSIQYQTLKDIEIIAVNDFSKDKTFEILKQLSLEDKRIKIINNTKNYGLLYSRTMGVLNSKGEYLMNLDPDDTLKGKYALETIYNLAKSKNVDILSFGVFVQADNEKLFKCSIFNKVFFQPNIFESSFSSDNYLTDFFIVNKLIRRELFLKVYGLFMFQTYKKFWNYHEDNIWSILVNKYANSKICTKKVIYFYKNNKESLMKNYFSITNAINSLYRHQMYSLIFKKQNEKKYLFAETKYLIYTFKTMKNIKNLTKQNDLKSNYIKIFINESNSYNNLTNTQEKIIKYFWK